MEQRVQLCYASYGLLLCSDKRLMDEAKIYEGAPRVTRKRPEPYLASAHMQTNHRVSGT